MVMKGRKYNIVIFGATGFTGKHVILEIIKTLEKSPDDKKFTWAIAGRSVSKLDNVLQEMSQESGTNLNTVAKIVADVSDPESLRAMARQAEVVLNCVGPYLLWGGEEVVRACVAEGTHHLDLSGEPQFLEVMQLKYNKEAEESGAYIIGACGFDSIPADYGSVYLEKKFEGELNSVESYMQIHKGTKTPKLNFGTWHSGVIMCNRFFELLSLKKKLYPEPFFKFQHKMGLMPIKYCEEVKGWTFVLPFPDTRVMERTQRYKYYNEKRRPFQTQAYMKAHNLFIALLMAIGSLFLGIFAQFKFGVRLLEKYPEIFSLGMVTKKGPSKEEMDNDFCFTLIGKGWDKTAAKIDGEYINPPNKTAVLKVRGKNPGYGATVTMMLQAGLSIIYEPDLMPSKGGVYTPGIAFARTTLVDRLNRNGVTFTLEKL